VGRRVRPLAPRSEEDMGSSVTRKIIEQHLVDG